MTLAPTFQQFLINENETRQLTMTLRTMMMMWWLSTFQRCMLLLTDDWWLMTVDWWLQWPVMTTHAHARPRRTVKAGGCHIGRHWKLPDWQFWKHWYEDQNKTRTMHYHIRKMLNSNSHKQLFKIFNKIPQKTRCSRFGCLLYALFVKFLIITCYGSKMLILSPALAKACLLALPTYKGGNEGML